MQFGEAVSMICGGFFPEVKPPLSPSFHLRHPAPSHNSCRLYPYLFILHFSRSIPLCLLLPFRLSSSNSSAPIHIFSRDPRYSPLKFWLMHLNEPQRLLNALTNILIHQISRLKYFFRCMCHILHCYAVQVH
jgi:hypothetical protein